MTYTHTCTYVSRHKLGPLCDLQEAQQLHTQTRRVSSGTQSEVYVYVCVCVCQPHLQYVCVCACMCVCMSRTLSIPMRFAPCPVQ